ncbi:hypothetical protein QJS83_05925 [Bdellovibrio sp. 22V]|uniref:hypothetical protein n=1 Tax=Bdellovibrio TaxID=958 RepID=UPI0025431650|nr:hypothetical protein [Bdellovibrio sp. 22V]WII73406.1 hypothetical protein QJS83_05925 [Bdellovibrio sp. 22V]
MILGLLTMLQLLMAVPAFTQEISKKDCSAVDASTHMGPVRDQGSIGWCFAFASADVMTEYLKLDPTNRVSAFDVALQYYKNEREDFIRILNDVWTRKALPSTSENRKLYDDHSAMIWSSLKDRPSNVMQMQGGWSDLSLLSYNNKSGVCTERNLPSELPLARKERENYIYESLALEYVRAQNTTKPFECPPFFSDSELTNLTGVITDIINKGNKNKVLGKIEASCSNRMPLTKPLLPSSTWGSPSANMAQVNKNLSKNIPTIISYDAQKIFGDDARVRPSMPTHASSIVGRRWNTKTKTCEFKLRNTWGTSWCPSSRFPADRCDKGNVWLTAKELAPFISATTHILP